MVDVLQVGVTHSGRPYIVMPFQSLDSLAVRVRREGPVPWQEATRLGVRLAGALESAHRVGILHRDVKPANILLSDYGEPQITDFGIARIEGGFETATGAFTGSLSHSAPEVLNGRPPTPQSDIYVFAAALFSIIAGRAAFERREGEEIIAQFLRITGQPIPDLRGHGVPDELCAVLERAMAKDPGDRPASAEAFGRELQEVQHAAGLPVTRMALPVGRRPAGDQTATQAPAAREAQSLHPRGPSPLVERAMAGTSEPPRPPEVTRRLDSGTSRPSPAAPPVVESWAMAHGPRLHMGGQHRVLRADRLRSSRRRERSLRPDPTLPFGPARTPLAGGSWHRQFQQLRSATTMALVATRLGRCSGVDCHC